MTDFVFVRHGETIWHAANRYAGRTDVSLTLQGKAQAELLAEWAATAGLAACWSSTMARARQTLAPAAHAAGLRAQHDERLRELDFGEGEGMTVAEMGEEFPEELAAFRGDPVAHHLPGGEDPIAAVERATRCLTEIATMHPDGRVLVVWHSTLMRLALCDLVGIPLREYRRAFPLVRNIALTEVRVTGERAALLTFNCPPETVPGGDRRPSTANQPSGARS